MVDQCANPECRKKLHYLRDGIVYLFSSMKDASVGVDGPHHMEHYWLCGECAKKWALEVGPGDKVQLLPREKRRPFITVTERKAPLHYAAP